MKKQHTVRGFALLLIGVMCWASSSGLPCSTFVLRDGKQMYLGRNWDHFSSLGLIIVNKRDMLKKALLAPPEKPVQWISRYGSVTFNQIGKEFPFGGMNEKGLVVEMMWLEETQYPEPDERPAIMELQWIQYQLDNCATVQEVIQSEKTLRISQNVSKQHYLICDRFGNTATVEFIKGKMIFNSGEYLPVEALTNNTYETCIELYNEYKTYNLDKQIAHTTLGSRDRFIKLARRLNDYRAEDIGPPVEYAFDMLASVGVGKVIGKCTGWSIVYDVMNLRIYFKTFENRNIRTVNAMNFDFSGSSPSMMLNMNKTGEGDVSDDFELYSRAGNDSLLQSVLTLYEKMGFIQNTMMVYPFLSSYPETVHHSTSEDSTRYGL
jgi:penicillin V acylase-like amidase (Ntn superfamily)